MRLQSEKLESKEEYLLKRFQLFNKIIRRLIAKQKRSIMTKSSSEISNLEKIIDRMYMLESYYYIHAYSGKALDNVTILL